MRILVCYDASPIAEKALEKAIHLTKTLSAELHIFTSIPPIKDSSEVFEFIKNKDEEEIAKRKVYMVEAEQKAAQNDIDCHIHISNEGKRTGGDIVDFAEEITADYLVIGVRKRSKFDKMIFGSNVQYVVLSSPCPVMTVN